MVRVGQALPQKSKDGETCDTDLGFFPNDKKWWIIAKSGKKESVKEVFNMTDIIITMGGKNHLRAAIGSGEYQEEFVMRRCLIWSMKKFNWQNSSDTAKGMLRSFYLRSA